MKRMKTFFKYFLALILVYIITNFISFYMLKSTYKTKDYSVENSILDITVEEAKATLVNGYVSGIIRNNTEVDVNNKYLKVESYSKRDVLLGTKYLKLNDLNIGEEQPFKLSFNYEHIDHIKLYIIDETELPPKEQLDFGFDNPDDAKITFLVIMSAVIFIWF